MRYRHGLARPPRRADDRAGFLGRLLAPGGRLFIREAYPMLWALDEARTDAVSHSWNHGLGEIMTAMLDEGMTITRFVEHNSVPWNGLPGQMELIEGGEWRLADRPERLAHSYTLEAVAR